MANILESKEIGLPISLTGTHSNTEVNQSGKLSLKIVDTDGSGNPVYANEGTWTSDTINLEDKFADFDKVFTTDITNGSSSIAIQTRVSDNRVDWSEWLAIAEDGTIQSETKQYIQVKINFFAGFETDVYLVSDFSNADDVSLFDNNAFVSTSNGFRLKREHEFDMTLDSTWIDEGSLHRKAITRDEWVRIDKMKIPK